MNVTPDYVNVGIFIMVLILLLNGLSAAANVYQKVFKRTPTVDQSLGLLRKELVSRDEFNRHISADESAHNQFRDDLARQRSYTAKTTREIFDELRKMNTSLNKELQDVNKSIGRLEGKIEHKD